MKVYCRLSIIVLLSAIFSCSSTPERVIICDIHDVIAKVYKPEVIGKILSFGIAYDLALYYGWEWQNLKERTFEFLTKEFGDQEPLNPKDPKEKWCYVLGDGDSKLPKIMCDHKAGRKTALQILKETHEHIETPKNFTFSSEREKRVIKELLNTLFQPHIVAHSTHPIRPAIDLLKECLKDGKTQIMILSNFPADAFEEFYNLQETQDFCKELKIEPQHIIISGTVGFVKPDINIYEYLKLELAALNPQFKDAKYLKEHAVFIDDKLSNLEGAELSGLTGIRCDGNYKNMRDKLLQLHYLKA